MNFFVGLGFVAMMSLQRTFFTICKRLFSDPGRFVSDVHQESLMLYCRLTTSSYEDAYDKYMELTVQRQGKEAAGCWAMGRRQLSFLQARGLEPDDRLLEIGCGTLRAGKHFISYLQPGRYAGIDISQEAIETGKQELGEDVLAEKRPTLHSNDDLRFEELVDCDPFDYVISIGVFTQLKRRQITECFAHLDRVLSPDGEFYVAFNIGTASPERTLSLKSYAYEESELRRWANDRGLAVQRVEEGDCPLSNQATHTTHLMTWREG